MPIVGRNESQKSYMHRCVPQRQHEHPDEKIEQSVAVCFSMWKKGHKPKKNRKGGK